MPTQFNAKKTWKAMICFSNDEPMSANQWEALSWLTLIDRKNLYFGPDNTRWAVSEAERADNLKFFKSLGPSVH